MVSHTVCEGMKCVESSTLARCIRRVVSLLQSLSLDMASYIWDLLFLDGEITLFVAAVAMLSLVSERLLPKSLKKKPRGTFSRGEPRSAQPLLSNHRGFKDDDYSDEDEEVALHRAFDRIR